MVEASQDKPLSWESSVLQERLPTTLRSRFLDAFARLRDDPRRPRPGLDVKPLAGRAGLWRLRVGDYRAVYEVSGTTTIVVTYILHRSVAYR